MPVTTIDLPKVTVEVVTLNGVPMNRVTITTSGDLKEIRWDLLPVSLAVQQLSGAGGTAGVPGSSDATAALQSAGNTLLTAIRDAQPLGATEATLAARIPVNGQALMAASLPVVLASNQTPVLVMGSVAAGVADSGNPIKFGGVYSAALPSLGNGQRANAQLTSRGELIIANQDFVSSPINVAAADIGSTSAAGANGQIIVTGTPTVNSVASIAGRCKSTFAIQVGGTWVGTLQFERSLDSGATWTAITAFSAGTNYVTQTTTANGNFHGNASSSANVRVRATDWTSGTASVVLTLGGGTSTVIVGNPLRLWDQVSGALASIKPASTAPLVTDAAIVVTISPNTPALLANLGTIGGIATEATLAARIPIVGQKTAAASVPVVIASDQLPIATRSLTVATALQALTVTAGAYLALDVFGGLITFTGVFPDVGTGPRGGRTLTLTEITVETGGAFALGVIACSRTPVNASVDNAVFTFEGARQLAMRQLSTAVQTDANSWTAYLTTPLTITQDVADTTNNFCLYLISLTAQSHVGAAAWVRLGGYID